MKIDSCSSFFIKADQFFDKVPVASTFTNFINLFQKSFVLPFMEEETIKKNRYYTYLNEKSYVRCLTLLIPILGNIVIALFNCKNKKNQIQPHKQIRKQKVKPNPLPLHALDKKEKLTKKELKEIENIKTDPFMFREASSKIKNHKNTVLNVVEQHSYLLEHASLDRRDDEDVVLAANKLGSNAFRYASVRLKTDRDFVLQLVKKNGFALEFVQENFKKDQEIVQEAIKSTTLAFQFASSEIKNNKLFVLKNVNENVLILEWVNASLQDDEEVIISALKKDASAFNFASSRLKNNRDFVLRALKENAAIFKYMSDVFKADPECVLEVVKKNSQLFNQPLHDELKNNTAFALRIVAEAPSAIGLFSDDIKDNKEIMTAVVKMDGCLLSHCSPRLKDDDDVVLEAIKQSYRMIDHASDRLKNDRVMGLEVVKQYHLQQKLKPLKYLHENLTQNVEIRQAAGLTHALVV